MLVKTSSYKSGPEILLAPSLDSLLPSVLILSLSKFSEGNSDSISAYRSISTPVSAILRSLCSICDSFYVWLGLLWEAGWPISPLANNNLFVAKIFTKTPMQSNGRFEDNKRYEGYEYEDMKKYFKNLQSILLTSSSLIECSLFLPLLFHKFLMTIRVVMLF